MTLTVDLRNDDDLKKLLADRAFVQSAYTLFSAPSQDFYAMPPSLNFKTDPASMWKYTDWFVADYNGKLGKLARENGWLFVGFTSDNSAPAKDWAKYVADQVEKVTKVVKFYVALQQAANDLAIDTSAVNILSAIQAPVYGALAINTAYAPREEIKSFTSAAGYAVLAGLSIALGSIKVTKLKDPNGLPYTLGVLDASGTIITATSQVTKTLESVAKMLAELERLTNYKACMQAVSQAAGGVGAVLSMVSSALSLSAMIYGYATGPKSDGINAAYGAAIGQTALSLMVSLAGVALSTVGLISAETGVGAVVASAVITAFSPLTILQGAQLVQYAKTVSNYAHQSPTGYSGDAVLGDLLNYEGSLQIGINGTSQPVANLMVMAPLWVNPLTMPFVAFFAFFGGTVFKQMLLEQYADHKHAQLLAQYGSMPQMWDSAFQDRFIRTLQDSKLIDSYVQMKADLDVSRLLVFTPIAADDYMRHLAAIVKEGASLPSFGFKAFHLSADNQPVDQSSKIDWSTGTIDLSSLAKSQYVTSLGPLPSPSLETRERVKSGKNQYTTELTYTPRSWDITDGGTSTTFDARVIAARDFSTRTKFRMGGGDDVIVAGARPFDLDGGDGNDGVDYSAIGNADELKALGKSAEVNTYKGVTVTAGPVGSHSYVVDKGGVKAEWYTEYTQEKTYTYGKRKETIQYTDIKKEIGTIDPGTQDRLTHVEWVRGSIASDTFQGNADDDVWLATTGNDDYSGGGGLDVLDYAPMTAWAIRYDATLGRVIKTRVTDQANGGLDTVKAVPVIRGTVNADQMLGGWGKDVLIGNGGADTLSGGAGDDLLMFGSKSQVDGGTGDDALVVSDDNPRANNIIDGGRGHNSLNYSALGADWAIWADLSQGFAKYVYQGQVGGYNLSRTQTYDTNGYLQTTGMKVEGLSRVADIDFSNADLRLTMSGGAMASSLRVTDLQKLDTHMPGRITFWAVTVEDSNVGPCTKAVKVQFDDATDGGVTVKVTNAAYKLGTWVGVAGTINWDWAVPNTQGNWQADTIQQTVATDAKVNGYGISRMTIVNTQKTTIGSAGMSDIVQHVQDLAGTGGNDLLVGNAEDNVLSGLAGNDTLHGLGGDDVLLGGDGDDQLFGEAGNDWIHTGLGNDTVDAGSGDDMVVVAHAADWHDVKCIDGGQGKDTVDYSGITPLFGIGIVARLMAGQDGEARQPRGGSISQAMSPADVLRNIENLRATAGDDDVTASDAGCRLEGLAGNDTLRGGAGNDTLDGGDGNDRLFGGAGSDVIITGLGLDTVDAGAGNDYIAVIHDKARADNKVINGGEGNDTADYRSLQNAGITVDLSAATPKVQAGASQDTLLHVENIDGTESNDVIRGDAQANQLGGFGGDDVIDGGAGNDVIYGGEGNDTLIGGDGNDVIYAGLGRDVVDAGTGDDIVYVQHKNLGTLLDVNRMTADQLQQIDIGALWRRKVDFNGDGVGDCLVHTTATTADAHQAFHVAFGAVNGKDVVADVDENGSAEGVDFSVWQNMDEVWMADFNGDGKTDVLRRASGTWDSQGQHVLQVYFSDGHGGFKLAPTDPHSNTPGVPVDQWIGAYTQLYTGDFNGDGYADVLRQEKGAWADGDNTGTLQVYLGDGHGGFNLGKTDARANVLGVDPSDVSGSKGRLVVGDFNGDGLDDFIAQASERIYLNDGQGGFVSNAACGSLWNTVKCMSALDVDGDGRDELWVLDAAMQSQVYKLSWVDKFQDALRINGGSGNDSVDYRRSPNLGSGLDADLSNVNAQTVTLGITLCWPGDGQVGGVGGNKVGVLPVGQLPGSVTDTLQNVENLAGTAFADCIKGSAANNILVGLDGNDILDGGAGNDVLAGGSGLNLLTGGAGQDVFRFDVLDTTSCSTITDFTTGQDRIALTKDAFKALANLNTLGAANVCVKGSAAASSGQAYVVYDKTTGELGYDAAGGGSMAQVFAVLTNKPQDLTASSFVVL
jgi:Ca2+-binding RTX toxin-like protein